jgi:hypothetical protein
MVYTKEHFNARIGAVTKKSSRRGRTALVARVDANGVVYAKAKRRRVHIPVKGLMFLVLAFFGFKAFMLAANGPETYQERLALLENGTAIEAFGARIMSIDPATQFLADKAGPIFR